MSTDFYLNNPPIKEVALGLYLRNPKYDIEFIKNYKEQYLADFKNELPFKTIDIKIGDGEEIEVKSQQNFGAYTLSNDSNDELWNIDLNRILFVDKTKYSNFENFLNKFLIQFDNLYENLGENLNCEMIALRYSNEFSFKIADLYENFAILPMFRQEYENSLYASNSSYMCVVNIVNSQDNKITATVNTNFIVDNVDTTKLLINFDIEVKYTLNKDVCLNTERFKEYLTKMRLFKNKIFFSNIIRAKEVFN